MFLFICLLTQTFAEDLQNIGLPMACLLPPWNGFRKAPVESTRSLEATLSQNLYCAIKGLLLHNLPKYE